MRCLTGQRLHSSLFSLTHSLSFPPFPPLSVSLPLSLSSPLQWYLQLMHYLVGICFDVLVVIPTSFASFFSLYLRLYFIFQAATAGSTEWKNKQLQSAAKGPVRSLRNNGDTTNEKGLNCPDSNCLAALEMCTSVVQRNT